MNTKLSKFGYLITSLILAILLAAYVNGQHDTSITRNVQSAQKTPKGLKDGAVGLISKKRETISVPLQLNGINTDDYYVSGAPETVKITVSGSPALVTSAKNTKNFQVYADLKHLNEGRHTIKLKASGISNDLTYTIDPTDISVDIAKKAISNYTVQTKYDSQAIANGYHVGKVTSSVHNVEVMGTADVVQTVQSVVAVVNSPRDTKKSIRQDVTLQALDEHGKPVNVAISPQVTTVDLPVIGGEGSRQVPIKFRTENGDAKNFEFSANVNEVTINGKMKDIEGIKSITVPIDVKNIHTKESLTVKPTAIKNVKIDPEKVKVQVTPKEQN